MFELPFSHKKTKKLSNKQLSEALPFSLKKGKKLNKYEILKYIFPPHDAVDILKKQYAFRGYAEAYNVEVIDKKSASDSLFLAKISIVDLFKDLLQEKKRP